MKQSEYILATDLQKIRTVHEILHDIILENSIIDKSEYVLVIGMVNKWTELMYNRLQVEGENGC